MLKRKEILVRLRELGVSKVSELKSGCRDFEIYYRRMFKEPVKPTRQANIQS
ncbi:MAG: hypothetical protein QF502_05200 [Nitrospinaceae bacterium]|jgi:hypothetical protein|nr:hypothetical protein [Nitrospinaceae bacterium]MDP6657453.1 hypothetical protein [Nitrospinaceae bacterium]MDP7057519.1 hypothetical protein [Nitrospinaceae bacterium]